ncbi:hypothetical protein D3C80_1223620 [compost metagenome]
MPIRKRIVSLKPEASTAAAITQLNTHRGFSGLGTSSPRRHISIQNQLTNLPHVEVGIRWAQ